MLRTPLNVEWLTSLKGVGEATALKLRERFESVEELAGAEPNRTAGDLKASRNAVYVAVLAARELLKQNQKNAPQSQPAATPSGPDLYDPDDPFYVVRHTQVDRFTKIATRVLVTPSVCPVCGYDAAEKMGAEGWDALDDVQKPTAQRLLEKHSEFHAPGEARLLRKSELPTMNLKPIG